MKDIRVGIVGAGVMGVSLAHALTATGYDVSLYDHDAEALGRAARRMRQAGRIARLGGAGPGASVEQAGELYCVTTLDKLGDCGVVIENVTEDPVAKEHVHRTLDDVLPATAVVAVNTSAVSISEIALTTRHPDRVVGAHFMNPVSQSTMVEVIATPYAASWALETMQRLIRTAGKESVVVSDATGFVINRCLMIFINEAAALLDDGVATPHAVDRLFRGCLGHRTGPLRTADIIGIDTIVHTLNVLSRAYGPARFTPSARLRQMVDEGHLGYKSGRGFYSYVTEGDEK
ncbi:3-hydroxyacyl-CoA dehydrogenase family protein [Streptomyces sp900105245]|uniref:3-hydroxyacyl-CoA dehydrogenase family protein n=1 Tax=Streptomyces sp. 900105245 TaxID=3154379 RepID=A0ABV1UJ64_9ACTN